MTLDDETVIPLSRIKIVLLVCGACLFVAGGVWMLQLPAEEIVRLPRFNDPLLVRTFGWVGIVFFGACGVSGVVKLFDDHPGLFLNNKGMTDNASAVAAGFIPWSEIVAFTTYQVRGQQMLVVHVRAPDKYIKKGNVFRQHLNSMNHRICGSPIVITSSALKLNYEQLFELCERYRQKYALGALPAGN